MIGQIFGIVAPVFVLSCFGFFWVRRGLPYDISFVSRLAMDIGMPCLLLATLARVDIDPKAFRDLALASLLFYGLLGVGAAVLLRVMGLSLRAWLSPFVFGNTGNLGLPLALFAFGDEGLAYALVIFAVMAIVNFTIGVWIVSGEGSPARALKQPMVYGALIGAVFSYQGWALPVWLDNTLSLAGQIAIPLMLITLGVSMARLGAEAAWRPILLSGVKLAGCFALALALAQMFGLAGAALGAFVLQAITPVAVTSYLLAERFNTEPAEIARFVVVSTLLSVIALPAAIGWLLP